MKQEIMQKSQMISTGDLMPAARLSSFRLLAHRPHYPSLAFVWYPLPLVLAFPSSVLPPRSDMNVAAVLLKSEVAQRTSQAYDLEVCWTLSPQYHHLTFARSIPRQ